jgi:hypothetical protein
MILCYFEGNEFQISGENPCQNASLPRQWPFGYASNKKNARLFNSRAFFGWTRNQ